MTHPHKNDVYISNPKFSAIFDVDELIIFSQKYKVTEISVNNLLSKFYNEFQSVFDEDTEQRINNANLVYPIILVSNKKQKIIAVLDGTHRIRKAIKSDIKKIKAIIIPKKDMNQFRSSKLLGQIIVGCSKLKAKELKLLQSLIQNYY
jgi:hypothetical protein